MDKDKLKRNTPLKLAVHIVMLFAFAAGLLCWMMRPEFMKAQGALASKENTESNSYFSSQMFFDNYGISWTGFAMGWVLLQVIVKNIL